MQIYNDNVGSSMQKLRAILQQYGILDGFDSSLPDKNRQQLSDEIVNAILSEIQNFLINVEDCEIDQVSGRIETKLAKLGHDGISLSDESLAKIREILLNEFAQTISDDENTHVGDNDIAKKNGQPSALNNGKKDDIADKIADILNNINKEKKLDDFKEFIGSIGGKSVQLHLFRKRITEKTLDEILPKVQFFKNKLKFVNKIIFENTVQPMMTISKEIEKNYAKFIVVGQKLVKNVIQLIKETLKLTMAVFTLAGSNIVLAAAYIAHAASTIVLSASVLVLAASNLVLTVSRLTLLAAMIIFTVGVLTVAIAFMAIVSAMTILASVLVAGMIITATAVIVGVLVLSAALVMASVLTALVLISTAVIVFMTSLMLAAGLLSVGAVSSAILLSMAIMASAVIISAALAAGGGILCLSALILAAVSIAIGLVLLSGAVFFVSGMYILYVSLYALLTAVIGGIAALIGIMTVSLGIVLYATIAAVLQIVSTSIITVNLLISAAVLTVAATTATMMLVLLLGLALVLTLGIFYFRDRLLEELKKTTLYDWWTKDVSPAGGLWIWLRQWFLTQWPWMDDIWGYIKWRLMKLWRDTWLYRWWVDEVEASGGLWGWIKYKMDECLNWLYDIGEKTWNSICQWFDKTYKWVGDFWGTIRQAFNNWWENSSIKGALDGVSKWIQDKIDSVQDTLTFGLSKSVREAEDSMRKLDEQTCRQQADDAAIVRAMTDIDALRKEIARVEALWKTNKESNIYSTALMRRRSQLRKLEAEALLKRLKTEVFNDADELNKFKKQYKTYKINGQIPVSLYNELVFNIDRHLQTIQSTTPQYGPLVSSLDDIEKQRRDQTIGVSLADDMHKRDDVRQQSQNRQDQQLKSVSDKVPSKKKPLRVEPVPMPFQPNYSAIGW